MEHRRSPNRTFTSAPVNRPTPTFQGRHYQTVADAIAGTVSHFGLDASTKDRHNAIVMDIVRRLGVAFQEDNDRFQMAAWLQACYPTDSD